MVVLLPQRTSLYVENNFSAGLKTEYTGLNFPENAVTACNNTVFTITGEVDRRLGFDFESGGKLVSITAEQAKASYRWNNVAGDGQTQIMVVQNGNILSFFVTSNSVGQGISSTQIASTVDISAFMANTNTNTPANIECQFADGNGYLFVFHPYLDPFYCTYNSSTAIVTATVITVKIRDFAGIYEPGVDVNLRPNVLSAEHQYNLQNQGWVASPNWTGISTSSHSIVAGSNNDIGSYTYTVQTGLPVVNGQGVLVSIPTVPTQGSNGFFQQGAVSTYTATTLVLNIVTSYSYATGPVNNWVIQPLNSNLINIWNTALSNYPSNSDVWWSYKILSNGLEVFPTSTSTPSLVTSVSNAVVPSSPAPNGHYILEAFNQNKSAISSIGAITGITTPYRPITGVFFQGRVWYAGINASQQALGDEPYFTWTENIYFSQVVSTPASTAQFGMCYQVNDPTDETFFDLLPTDGGVINIQGSGAIYKLFPIQNGLLVFAANGIWFITGSTGIGFSATDYTITKISGVQSISGTSFVNLQGFPVFWNEEGIYAVKPSQQGGGLTVENIVLGNISTFYGNIPNISKQYVRGDYNPLTYIMQWCYRSVPESGVGDRYFFDTILNYLVPKQCFYIYTVTGVAAISDVKYVNYPSATQSPDPTFKYLTSYGASYTFSEESNVNYLDWGNSGLPSGSATSFVSSFITGYKLHGRAITKWQSLYLYMFSSNFQNTGYSLQGIWDFAISGNSGKISTRQVISNVASSTNFSALYRRHKIRGRGLVFQIEITSIPQVGFNFYGWSMIDQVNVSI